MRSCELLLHVEMSIKFYHACVHKPRCTEAGIAPWCRVGASSWDASILNALCFLRACLNFALVEFVYLIVAESHFT